MTDSNDDLARAEAALAATAEMLRQMRAHDEARNQRRQLKLAAQKALTERLERDRAGHADRMAKLEDIQADIRGMMQMLARRWSVE
jgi:septal ring factor EnvC (AmiA/AmiB activator)